MTTSASHRKQTLIAGRARRIGWGVETDDQGREWLYRIRRPDGKRVILTKSPSDVNWEAAVLKRLNGPERLFDQAEAAWQEQRQATRRRKLAADKAAADKAVAKATRAAEAITRAAGPYAIRDADPAWLLTPHNQPETKLVIIGPELAQKTLDAVNGGNRPFRQHRADEFAQIIRDGEWAVTHQGAAIDNTGTLQDGQHRFAAIAQTGEPQHILVSVGMPPENFTRLDTPLVRTARDALGMRGEKDVTTLTSTARLIINFDRNGRDLYARKGQTKITIATIDKFVTADADNLRHAVRRTREIRNEIKIIASPLAASIYLIGRAAGHQHPDVHRYFDHLATGIGIDKDDPIYLLRRHLLRRDASRPRQYATLAYILKTWNYRAAGRKPKHLTWGPDDGFPATIIVPPPTDTPRR